MAEYKKVMEEVRLEREKMAKKTWVPVCGFCMAWDKRRGSKLLEDWHRYDDGDHGELRFGPAPTQGSCALKVAKDCRGHDYVTPVGEGVLKEQPPKNKSATKRKAEKAARKTPPGIYPPWSKVE